MAKYSVVIPAYNVENYISDCIGSLKAQSFLDFEVVIINDGSCDNTENVCRELIKNDSRFKLISQKNQGPVRTRINGFNNSSGEYVVFLDSDDYISLNRLEEFERLLCSDIDIDLIVASYSTFDGVNSNPITNYFSAGIYDLEKINTEILPNLLAAKPHFNFGIKPSLWECCFKREILEKCINNVPDGITIGEDMCLTYSYLLECKKIAISNDSGYFYRNNATSLTHTCNAKQLDETIVLFDFVRNLPVPTENWKAQVEEYTLYMAWYIIRKVLKAENITWCNKIEMLNSYCNQISINQCIKNTNNLEMSFRRKFRYLCIKRRLWRVLLLFV